MKLDRNTLILLAVIGLAIMWSCSGGSTSTYVLRDAASIPGGDYVSLDAMARVDGSDSKIDLTNIGCAMNSGTGLASSLLPREVKGQEDYGSFSPDQILEGQNFLDPRSQIGFPETVGGALRNANQSIRADPPNPKRSYEWNNSTIVPDLMQRTLC